MKSYFEIEHMFMEMGINLEKCSDLAWNISMGTAIIGMVMVAVIVILVFVLLVQILSIENIDEAILIPIGTSIVMIVIALLSCGSLSILDWAQIEMINVVIKRNGL